MQQAPMIDGLPFDPFSLFDDSLGSAEAGVGESAVVQALVVSLMIGHRFSPACLPPSEGEAPSSPGCRARHRCSFSIRSTCVTRHKAIQSFSSEHIARRPGQDPKLGARTLPLEPRIRGALDRQPIGGIFPHQRHGFLRRGTDVNTSVIGSSAADCSPTCPPAGKQSAFAGRDLRTAPSAAPRPRARLPAGARPPEHPRHPRDCARQDGGHIFCRAGSPPRPLVRDPL